MPTPATQARRPSTHNMRQQGCAYQAGTAASCKKVLQAPARAIGPQAQALAAHPPPHFTAGSHHGRGQPAPARHRRVETHEAAGPRQHGHPPHPTRTAAAASKAGLPARSTSHRDRRKGRAFQAQGAIRLRRCRDATAAPPRTGDLHRASPAGAGQQRGAGHVAQARGTKGCSRRTAGTRASGQPSAARSPGRPARRAGAASSAHSRPSRASPAEAPRKRSSIRLAAPP
jgi:hypothetical protein